MNTAKSSTPLSVLAAFPLLALILTAALLVAVRSGDRSVAPLPLPNTTAASVATAEIPATPVPKPTTPAADSRQNVVALVNGVAILQHDVAEAMTIDGIMAALAGQAPTPARQLVEQMVNTELVLQRAGATLHSADASQRLADFLQQHGRSSTDLTEAMQANALPQRSLDRYWERLVTADHFLHSQQSATALAPDDLIHIWQTEAHISFGPAADIWLGSLAVASPAATGQTTVVATPADAAAALAEPRGVEVGQLAPDFVLSPLDETSPLFSLDNLRGKPSVLVFWTTWCPYCLRQTPLLVDADSQWRNQGIHFVGISVEEERGAVASYVHEHQIQYPILLDETGAAAREYVIQGYPTTYFLDRDSRIVARHTGALSEEQLTTYLQALVQSPTAAP